MGQWYSKAVMWGLGLIMATAASAQDVSEYIRAQQAFDNMVTALAPKGEMPRLTDPKAAALIATLGDNQRFLGGVPDDVTYLGGLVELCGKANANVMAYLLFDLRKQINPAASPEESALVTGQVMTRNVHSFQDELGRLQPFVMYCSAKTSVLVNQLFARTRQQDVSETRAEGVRRIKAGFLGAYLATIQAAADTSLKEDYRATLVHAAADTAVDQASILNLDARRQILAAARTAARGAPEAQRADWQALIDAMSNETCSALCRW